MVGKPAENGRCDWGPSSWAAAAAPELEPTPGGAAWCGDHIFPSLGGEARAPLTSVSGTVEDGRKRASIGRIRETGFQPGSLAEAQGELPKRPGTAEFARFL